MRLTQSQSKNLAISNPKSLDINYDLYYQNTTTKDVVKVPGTTQDLDLSLQNYSTSISLTNEPFNNILRVVIDFSGTATASKSVSLKSICTPRVIGSSYNIGPEGATRTHNDTAGYKFHYKKTGEKEADFVCDYISNLIQFKGFLYSYSIGGTKYDPSSGHACLIQTDKRIDYTSDTTLFTSAESIFNDITAINTFVSGSSKNSTVNMAYSQIPAEATEVELFVEYNYNDNLITNYLNNCEYLRNREFGGSFDPTKESINVTFAKDLVSIEINTES